MYVLRKAVAGLGTHGKGRLVHCCAAFWYYSKTTNTSRVQVELLQLTNSMVQSCAASWLGAEEES